MRFSIWPSAGQPWSSILATAEWAERAGWLGAWMSDHLLPSGPDPDQPVVECWSTLSALAATVPRLRLGSLVSSNTFRQPAVLAKQAATVAQIGTGGVVLGIGAGWMEAEHLAYGIPLPPTRERMDRLEEACALLRALAGPGRVSTDGPRYPLLDAPCAPPLDVRLLVGGGGERRTLPIAARYADDWNYWAFDGLPRKLEVLDRRCEEANRDPASLTRSTQAVVVLLGDGQTGNRPPTPPGLPTIVGTSREVADRLAALAAIGIDEFIVPDLAMPPAGAERWELLDRLHTDVVAELGT